MSATTMTEQDRQITAVMARERPRLRNFIRKRVANESDVDDLVQEVFCELVEANRLLLPIDYVSAWLFRVARNRITDLFRKKKPVNFADLDVAGAEGELLNFEDLLPSADDGPEALYARGMLMDALEIALDELPEEQRDVFIAHEIDGLSFKEIAAESGANMNTLLSRKRYAVLYLRERLHGIYDDFTRR